MDDVSRLIDDSRVGARTLLQRMTLSVVVLVQSRLTVDAGDTVASPLVLVLLVLGAVLVVRRREVAGRHVTA